ncbi:MAG TPA: damage-inducible protein CinA [Clostridiales bacterium]|nr:damage-inducible protein CinA [Clostridiales bacterium]
MVFDKLYYKACDVVEELRDCGLKITFAESLTGGMISSKLVDVPGSSDVFVGSVVSYTNDIKKNILNVSEDTIEAYTEVSEKCAVEMAEGARSLMKADIAVSATGYAGNYDNDNEIISEDNETGTVWLGFSSEDGSFAVSQFFPGNRDSVRLWAVETAFDMVLDYLKENYE